MSRHHPSAAAIERLESRLFLSATYKQAVEKVGWEDGTQFIIRADDRRADAVIVAGLAPGGRDVQYSINGGPTRTIPISPDGRASLMYLGIEGGRGNDRLVFDVSNGPPPFSVSLDGGKGDDVLTVTGEVGTTQWGPGGMTITMPGEVGYVSSGVGLNGGDGNDQLIGGGGSDFLNGGRGNDELHGNARDDHLDGGTGNDALDGRDGADSLYPGRGRADSAAGGGGDDTFYAGPRTDRRPNLITDLEPGDQSIARYAPRPLNVGVGWGLVGDWGFSWF